MWPTRYILWSNIWNRHFTTHANGERPRLCSPTQWSELNRWSQKPLYQWVQYIHIMYDFRTNTVRVRCPPLLDEKEPMNISVTFNFWETENVSVQSTSRFAPLLDSNFIKPVVQYVKFCICVCICQILPGQSPTWFVSSQDSSAFFGLNGSCQDKSQSKPRNKVGLMVPRPRHNNLIPWSATVSCVVISHNLWS